MESSNYAGMLKEFGSFIFNNWEIFLGLAGILLLLKFVKMGLGVARTLIILYVLFVVYKYQNYEQIKTQLVGDYDKASEKLAPLKGYVDNNLTSKIKSEDKAVLDKFIGETKDIVSGSFRTTEELIKKDNQ